MSERQCCQTSPGSRHEFWCENSQTPLFGYEAKTQPKERSEDAKTSDGNTATIRSRRRGVHVPGKPF